MSKKPSKPKPVEIVATVHLKTLCGCHQARDWFGIPPMEIKVPLPPSSTGGLRIRTFKLVHYEHPDYDYEEIP